MASIFIIGCYSLIAESIYVMEVSMRVALVLAGCGYLDGAEIRESVLALAFLDKHGATVDIFAPDQTQYSVMNHQTNEPVSTETRNVLTEAARIARGDIRALSEANAQDYDALVLPGGFGVAKNLSDLAVQGVNATVLPQFEALIRDFYHQRKPIGAMCIAPAVLAKALQGLCSPIVTVGNDEGVAAAIASWGGVHRVCASDEVCVDEANRLATCSAYMRDDRMWAIATGIEAVIKAILKINEK
jgi:enhancing lycopene biosynthesis protein 2